MAAGDGTARGTVRNVSAAPRELPGGGVVGIGEDAKDVDINDPLIRTQLREGQLLRVDDEPHEPKNPNNLDELDDAARERRDKAAPESESSADEAPADEPRKRGGKS